MSTNHSNTPESSNNQSPNGTPAARPPSPTFLNRVLTTAGTAINSIRRNASPHDANSSRLHADPIHANSPVANRADTPGINTDPDIIRPATPTFNPEGLFGNATGGFVNIDEDASYESVGARAANNIGRPSSPRGMDELEALLS